jgi:glycosyltransferase involved in cell wall biosynthesis
MACGVPVILSNVTGIASLLDERHAELITTVNNPLLLATQIEKVLAQTETHRQLTTQLTQRVADLAWPVIAKRVWQAYENLTEATSL